MTRCTLVSWLLAAVLAGGCAQRPLTGAPELRLGKHECGECGMQVNEDRCSAAALIEREGERMYVFFDDVGCLLDYQREHAGDTRVLERYVHDYATRAWVPAEGAVYVAAPSRVLRTPMGSGIVAFTERKAAEGLSKETGGAVLDATGIVTARERAAATR